MTDLIDFLRAREQGVRLHAETLRTMASVLPPDAGKLLTETADWMLREVEAKRRILDDITAERHKVVEDCWYTCAAATEERDGGESCNDNDDPGDPCNCGRDVRVERRLRLLALPDVDHPDYRAEWRP